MATGPEVGRYAAERREEPPGGTGGPEALRRTLPLPGRPVAVLGPVFVQALAQAVPGRPTPPPSGSAPHPRPGSSSVQGEVDPERGRPGSRTSPRRERLPG